MTDLVLNRRQNARNVQLTDDTPNQSVGYLLPDGEWRFEPWLGFIDREAARRLEGARPVRLVSISRVGHGDRINCRWDEVPADMYVHGCLTANGIYAVYDTQVVIVGPPKND